jgi:membrane protein required for colicin V production
VIADWNGFDWVLTSIIFISMALAFRRGLVRAIFGLLGFIGGFQLASWTYIPVADQINRSHAIQSQAGARIVAFLLIAAAIALAFEFVGRGLQKTLHAIGMSFFDRMLGAVFGFARGCLTCIALLMAITTIAPRSEAVTRSVLSPYLFAAAHDVSFLVPQYLQQEMIDGVFDFKKNTPRWINRH